MKTFKEYIELRETKTNLLQQGKGWLGGLVKSAGKFAASFIPGADIASSAVDMATQIYNVKKQKGKVNELIRKAASLPDNSRGSVENGDIFDVSDTLWNTVNKDSQDEIIDIVDKDLDRYIAANQMPSASFADKLAHVYVIKKLPRIAPKLAAAQGKTAPVQGQAAPAQGQQGQAAPQQGQQRQAAPAQQGQQRQAAPQQRQAAPQQGQQRQAAPQQPLPVAQARPSRPGENYPQGLPVRR
jgi:hypothetical protein